MHERKLAVSWTSATLCDYRTAPRERVPFSKRVIVHTEERLSLPLGLNQLQDMYSTASISTRTTRSSNERSPPCRCGPVAQTSRTADATRLNFWTYASRGPPDSQISGVGGAPASRYSVVCTCTCFSQPSHGALPIDSLSAGLGITSSSYRGHILRFVTCDILVKDYLRTLQSI